MTPDPARPVEPPEGERGTWVIEENENFPTLWRADAEWMLENRQATTEDGTVLTYADLLRNIIALFDLLQEFWEQDESPDSPPAPQGPDVGAIRARLESGVYGGRTGYRTDIATLLAALSAEKEAHAETKRLIEQHDAIREEGQCPSPIGYYEPGDYASKSVWDRLAAAEAARDAALADVERKDAVLARVRELADIMVKHEPRWYREAAGNFGKLLTEALDAAATTPKEDG